VPGANSSAQDVAGANSSAQDVAGANSSAQDVAGANLFAPQFGFVNAFKPPGLSSTAFGNWVRRRAGGAPVGHWGTLDPLGCGVLVLGIGKAARLFPLIADSRKSYVFELVVGERTDSGDASGKVIAKADVPKDWKDRLPQAARALIGVQRQVPPMHSAVKVGGKPLYRSARAGHVVPRAERRVTVYDVRVLPQSPEPERARLFVRCDAGTYVRVLCEHLGSTLRLPARMGALLRIAAGPFLLRDSVTPAQLENSFERHLIDPLLVLDNPRIELDESRTRRFIHGNEVACSDREFTRDGERPLVTHDGKLIGIGYIDVNQAVASLAPVHVFATA
jgi:tRNA pseudouridine55 synthase